MRVTQMHPKESLDAEDFAAAFPQGAIVTIESIDYKTLDAKKAGDAELMYFLKFRELRKPMRLNKTNTFAIAEHHGDETDDWIGKTIRLLGVQIAVNDRSSGRRKRVWTFDIDAMKPTQPPSLPIGTDITGAAAQSRALPHRAATPLPQGGAGAAMGELTPIGAEKAGDVVVGLSERGRTLDDLVAHLKSIGLVGLIENKLPPAWPQAVLQVARKFCSQLPKCAAPMAPSAVNALKAQWVAAPTEVVNTQTGEVITPAPATQAGSMRLAGEGQLPPQKPQTAAASQEFNEEDIPF